MIEIKMDGQQIASTACTYSPFDVDGNKKKGDHIYQLEIPKRYFVEKVEESYKSERPILNKEVPIGGDQQWPELTKVMENENLLKLLSGWYGSTKILEWVLPKPKNPQWCIVK